MDRRGRGESGPPAEHTLERQFDDVEAVIDAAAEPVDLLGHSYGAYCALGAATLVPQKVKHLVLYEPPSGDGRSDVVHAFEEMEPSEAVEEFMGLVGLDANQLAALKATPYCKYLSSFAPTMPSEGRALVGYRFEPARFSKLTMPALFLVGSQTEERLGEVLRMLRPVMPQAEWHVFEGHGHAATMTAPKLFTDTVLEFLSR